MNVSDIKGILYSERPNMKNIRTKLLILADDLTGALDSGVQFSRKGDKVLICTNIDHAFEHLDQADILVIDTESRHVRKEDAYQIVFTLVKKAISAGISQIYKKTDSGLRGNVGAELAAVLDASGERRVEFVPSWPKMNRTTRNGIHYVDDVPLAESVFASDVVDPVTESDISKLIHCQTDVPVVLNRNNPGDCGIIVYDCETDEELEEIGRQLSSCELVAGCAGLLEKYPKQSEKQRQEEEINLEKHLIVLSGSMNDVTIRQLKNAEEGGAYRVHAPMQKVVNNNWSDSEICEFCRDFLKNAHTPIAIIDSLGTFEQNGYSSEVLSHHIAQYMGHIAMCLLNEKMTGTFMIIGGDTLQGFIRELDIDVLSPVKEMAPGIVLARYIHNNEKHYLITKSGAFGTENQLQEIQEKL